MKVEKRLRQLLVTLSILSVLFLTKYNIVLGQANTLFGTDAGLSLTTGNSNTFIGYQSGRSNTTGIRNTFMGNLSGFYNTTGKTNTFIGYQSGYYNTEGSNNTFMGYSSGRYTTTGRKNTYLGFKSGYTNVSGTGNVFLGRYAGYYEKGSNKLYIANSKGTPLIYGNFSSKRVGIYKKNPSYTLDVNGKIRGDNVSASDVSLKKNISRIRNALEKVEGLRGVNFKWIDKSKGEGVQIGVIAQEVEKIIPEVVFEDNEGIKSVAYDKLVSVLIEATRELKAENETIKSENEQLKGKLIAVESRLDDLEGLYLAISTVLTKEKLVKYNQAELDEVQKTIQ